MTNEVNKEAEASEESFSQSPDQPESAKSSTISVEELEASLTQIKDQLLRKAAEFENYKKRTENEIRERIRFANEDLIFEILPIVDDFERSLKTGRDAPSGDVLLKGIELIYQKLLKILSAHGVTPFVSVGKPFDTGYHDALMQVHREDTDPHMVIEEVEKGFLMHGKVLRHAKVVVSAANPESGISDARNEMTGEGEES